MYFIMLFNDLDTVILFSEDAPFLHNDQLINICLTKRMIFLIILISRYI